MERKELVAMLELVGRALADGDMVPMFQCFSFHGKTVSAFNDSLGIVAAGCKVEEPFAVNGSTFLGLLQNCHSDLIEMKLEEHDVLIKTGRSTFRLPYFKEDAFLFEEPEDEWDYTLSIPETLIVGLGACLMTVSKSDTERKLMGVCIKPSKGGVGLYSCDGDGLTRAIIKQSLKFESEYKIPPSFCEAVLKIAADTEFKKGTLSLNKDWAKAELDSGYTVYGRMLENEDPLDHEALIKKTTKGNSDFVAIPGGFDHALSRARVVADPESAKTVLTIEGGRIKLLTEASSGIIRDSLALPKHPDVVADVSAELIQRPLSLCDEMAVLDAAVAYRKGEALLQIISNRND